MEKINIAELLKDCPEEMELDCTMYDNVTLASVDNREDIDFPIRVVREDGGFITLTKYGQYTDADFAKCVIFPKGKTTWEGFQRPFKDGDIVVAEDAKLFQMFILKEVKCHKNDGYNGDCYFGWDFAYNELFHEGIWEFDRLATEGEKQKLFDAIKANGYKWNPETKTLEKLEKEKFDITSLKPFDKVLIRDNEDRPWNIGFFSFKKDEYFMTSRGYYAQCIPYEENKHLLGTTNDCDEYYKTWE